MHGDFTTDLVEGAASQPDGYKIVHRANVTYWGDTGEHTVTADPNGEVDHLVTVNTGESGRLLVILDTVAARTECDPPRSPQAIELHANEVLSALKRVNNNQE